jgi:two-component system response regulator AtoC
MAASVGKEDAILIIDDDFSVRDFLARFFTQKGFSRIQAVDSGAAGVELVRTQDIKLVLCDVMLPGVSGLEVLRQIKSLHKDTGVIMITGFPEESIAKQAIKEGAYDYIIKPFDLTYLEMSVLTKIILMA